MTTTLVTGASSGIGRSLARRLALEGDPVVVVARRKELLDALVAEIASGGGRAHAIRCDVTDPRSVEAAVREAELSFGPIDRLVANAGGGKATSVDDFSAEHVSAVVDLNLMGVVNCIEAVLPGMLKRGSGHLVAVSSLAGYRGLPDAAAYSAAKAALTNLMESLRVDLRARGIDVTLIAPGFVRTKTSSKPRKKGRPFRMELEPATKRMARVIRQRRSYDAFPWTLVALAWLGRLLPAALFDKLVAGRGPKGQRKAR